MEDLKKNSTTYQNIILENRQKLNITGVLDVFSFDDQIIIVQTELGLLTIKGENLKINKLSLDTSDFIVDGTIISLNYTNSDVTKKNQNIFSKIFKWGNIKCENFHKNKFLYFSS